MSSQETGASLHSPTPEVLTEFILSLVQAFLRTGYYLPEHPESKKAKTGLYNRFKNLFTGRHELTFMLKEMGEVQDILVDGPLPETQRLNMLMTKGMAEIYTPRLAKFLERKDLVSLTLKERMSEQEFSRFIDVMSEPTFQTLDLEGKNIFVQRLREERITHISFVFNEDMVSPDRKLPWRVQLSISRLRKDLKCIPLFQNLDEEGFRSLRKQVIRDVLRPINKPNLMAAILLNSDLASTAEVSEDEVEDEVIAYISEKNLIETGRETLHAFVATEEGPDVEGRKRALVKFYERLHSTEVEGAEELIREFHTEGLVAFKALPQHLQDKLMLEKDTDRFLDERTRMLVLLENSPSADLYRARAEYLFRIIPELLGRDLLDEVLFLATTFRAHASMGGFREPTALKLLDQIITGRIGNLLKGRFLHGKKEDRLGLAPVFQALGDPWIPQLLEILEEAEDPWVRKNAVETLLRMGPEAETQLLKAICGGKLPPGGVAEILMVFGELGIESPAVLHVIQQHAQHKDPKIRDQAAWALCRIRGKDEEGLFLRLLDDPDMEVQKRAISCLRLIKSEPGLARLTEILHRLEKQPELKPLEVPIYQALVEFPDATIEKGVTTEQFLINLLKESYPSGLRSMLHRSSHPQLSGKALFAISETLSAIGTEASLEVLKSLAKRFREPIRGKLKRAIEHIETRVKPEDQEDRTPTVV